MSSIASMFEYMYTDRIYHDILRLEANGRTMMRKHRSLLNKYIGNPSYQLLSDNIAVESINGYITPELFALSAVHARHAMLYSCSDSSGEIFRHPSQDIMFSDPAVMRATLQPYFDRLGAVIVENFDRIENIPEYKLDYESFVTELNLHYGNPNSHYMFIRNLDNMDQLSTLPVSGPEIANQLTYPLIIQSCIDTNRALLEYIQLHGLPFSSLRSRLATDMVYLANLLERNEQIC